MKSEKSNKTINVKESVKNSLEALKIHDRETINDVIERMLLSYGERTC